LVGAVHRRQLPVRPQQLRDGTAGGLPDQRWRAVVRDPRAVGSTATVTRAVVLARGLGTRMKQADVRLDAAQTEAADRGIKAMMPIGPGGRPFLDFLLSALADAGYTEVCLIVAPDHDAIREHYRSITRLRLTFAVQAEPRGTADAVLAAESFA